MYRIGIVGSGADKFTYESKRLADKVIRDIIAKTTERMGGDICIVSGHSPVGGIDIWAEEIANEYGFPTDIKTPKQHTWDGEYGYKARNLDIARCSDEVHVILVDKLPPGYKGMQFKTCYHCAKHPEMKKEHVKSGGCWTGWKAYEMGKHLKFHIIKQ